MFGEAYIVPNSGTLMNDVVATEESVVLFFDIDRILTVCSSACPFHTQLIKNIFYTISDKNKSLVQKISYMSQRSTREKLLSYLSDEAERHNSNSFSIPFNRQQLADFLSVDRSAMSNELSKLRNEGMLDFHKNEFTLR
jgi:CRP-like cAMP-binding protein